MRQSTAWTVMSGCLLSPPALRAEWHAATGWWVPWWFWHCDLGLWPWKAKACMKWACKHMQKMQKCPEWFSSYHGHTHKHTNKWNLTYYHFLYCDGKKWKYIILMPETNTNTVSNHVLLTNNHVDNASGQWFFFFVASSQWVCCHVFSAEHAMQQVVRHFHSRRSVCILKRILYKQSTTSVWYGMVWKPTWQSKPIILEMYPV